MSKKYDVIIVGAGHNGLVAASYLAKAGKSVIVLEGESEIGGATASVKAFPEFEARLSRYSYLVSLLPDQIVKDLDLNFTTISRSVSSYTPYTHGTKESGLYIAREWDNESENSFAELTGSHAEATSWRQFYDTIATFAQRLAPSVLGPLPTRSELRDHIAMPELWDLMIENPIGEEITKRFSNDLVRGVVATDALIGTFTSLFDLQANRCFLYHLIGNGTGEWKVPQGGMGLLVSELNRVALSHGVTIACHSSVSKINSDSKSVEVILADGKKIVGDYLLSNAAPQVLARLRGKAIPKSLDGAQLKVNMLLKGLPRLKSGIDSKRAFAGTFHVNESFAQLEKSFEEADRGLMPTEFPLEMYCHTLTDPTILSRDLQAKGFHTLTLFGLHTPASLFDRDPKGSRTLALDSALRALNEHLIDPIESVIAKSSDGALCLEVKSPLDLEKDISLPRGNIFHRDLDFPFREDGTQPGWGVETDDPRIFICGAGAIRGGGVSGIPGHNAAMAVLENA